MIVKSLITYVTRVSPLDCGGCLKVPAWGHATLPSFKMFYFKNALGASRGVTSGEMPSIDLHKKLFGNEQRATLRHVSQNTQRAATRMHCKAFYIHRQWIGRVKTTDYVFMYLTGRKHHQLIKHIRNEPGCATLLLSNMEKLSAGENNMII